MIKINRPNWNNVNTELNNLYNKIFDTCPNITDLNGVEWAKTENTNGSFITESSMFYFKKRNYKIIGSDKNDLDFIQCACKFTEEYNMSQNPGDVSKREEMKQLIKDMKKKYDKIDINIFNSVQNVNLDTIISYRRGDEFHHFLDDYDAKLEEKKKE